MYRKIKNADINEKIAGAKEICPILIFHNPGIIPIVQACAKVSNDQTTKKLPIIDIK